MAILVVAIDTKEGLDNLKNIFGVDDYNWSVHKKDVFFGNFIMAVRQFNRRAANY